MCDSAHAYVRTCVRACVRACVRMCPRAEMSIKVSSHDESLQNDSPTNAIRRFFTLFLSGDSTPWWQSTSPLVPRTQRVSLNCRGHVPRDVRNKPTDMLNLGCTTDMLNVV